MFTFVPAPNVAFQCSWGSLGFCNTWQYGCTTSSSPWMWCHPMILLITQYHVSIVLHSTQICDLSHTTGIKQITCFLVEPHCSRATLICHDNTMTMFFCPPIWYNGTQILCWKECTEIHSYWSKWSITPRLKKQKLRRKVQKINFKWKPFCTLCLQEILIWQDTWNTQLKEIKIIGYYFPMHILVIN